MQIGKAIDSNTRPDGERPCKVAVELGEFQTNEFGGTDILLVGKLIVDAMLTVPYMLRIGDGKEQDKLLKLAINYKKK